MNNFPEWPLARQTPNETGCWEDSRISINPNDDSDAEYDFFVVIEDLLRPQKFSCRAKNSLLITNEPPDIRTYDKNYLKQFDYVLTCDQNIDHPGRILQQCSLPWHFGRVQINHENRKFRYGFDAMANATPQSTDKSRHMSVIVSNKMITPGHKKRLEFALRLKDRMGDRLDLFGRGFREIADKADAILPYRYHVALENSAILHYWTEKLSDTFLGSAMPIYFGCPNINDYFPVGAILPVTLEDLEKDIEFVSNVGDSAFKKAFPLIQESRRKILFEYNLFPMIHQFAKKHMQTTKMKCVTLRPSADFSPRRHSVIQRIRHKAMRFLAN